MTELDPVNVRVSVEADDALLKLRAVRDAIKEIRSKTVDLRIKESFDDGTKAAGDLARATDDAGRALKRMQASIKDNDNAWQNLWGDIRKGMRDAQGGLLANLGGAGKGWVTNVKRGFDDLQKSVRNVWSGIKDVTGSLSGLGRDGMTAGKAFGNLGSALAGSASALLQLAPAALSGGAAIGALVTALAAVSALLVALSGGLAAALLGLVAFGAVAYSTFSSFKTAYSGVTSAATTYTQASQNLNAAIKTGATDHKQYQAVMSSLEPVQQRAAKLLLDQNVQWQNLTPAQQNSLVALRNNTDAYKNLLPAQQNALNALLAEQSAWNQLTPAQQMAARSMGAISSAWGQLTQAMEPTIMADIAKALRGVQEALPFVQGFAVAAGKAIGTLLTQLDKFLGSKGFSQWAKQMQAEVGPAIIVIGHAIGNITVAFGQLFTSMGGAKKSSSDFATAMRVVVDIITGVLKAIEFFAKTFQAEWHTMSSVVSAFHSNFAKDATGVLGILTGQVTPGFATFAANLGKDFENIVSSSGVMSGNLMSKLKSLKNDILTLFAPAGTWLWNAGADLIRGMENGIQQMMNGIQGWLRAHVYTLIVNGIKALFGIASPSTVMAELGGHMASGLFQGLTQGNWDTIVSKAFGGITGSAIQALGWLVQHGQVAASSLMGLFGKLGSKLSGLLGSLFGGGGAGYSALKAAAAMMGWTGSQWNALVNVENREAGFNLTARNPSSGAYGMAQFINGPGEYAQYGGNWWSAGGQAIAMVRYILERYGNPANAWAHEQAFGWYARGGFLQPGGFGIVGEAGPELVYGGRSGATITSNAALAAMGGGDVTIHNVITLDGKTVYEGIQPHALRAAMRNGSRNGLTFSRSGR